MDSIARQDLKALEGRYGVERRTPNYVEAYPVLNVIQARRHGRSGRNMCLWFEGLNPVAFASVGFDDVDRLRVRLARPDVLSGAGRARHVGDYEFRVVYKGSQDNNQRPLLVCPVCNRARASLVFKSENWRCIACHGLQYRSTLVGSVVRRAERYARLLRELHAMVKKGRRADVIKKKKAEVAEALSKAGPLPHREANADYSKMVRALWRMAEFRTKEAQLQQEKTKVISVPKPTRHRPRLEPTIRLDEWMAAAGFEKRQ